MDNQHRKISGYRDLSHSEIDLINEAKSLESQCLSLHSRIRDMIIEQGNEPKDLDRVNRSQAFRWNSIARTDIETGFMALIRSIAQPQPKD